MWGAEHTAMLIAASGMSAWMVWGRNWSWLGALLLSQAPFWAGSAAYWLTGERDPVSINLAINLAAAALFISWAHRLQGEHSGGIVHVWLCLLFLGVCTLDVIQVIVPLSAYMAAQEAAHYAALLMIGGRAYVRGIDGLHRHRRDRRGSSSRGALV